MDNISVYSSFYYQMEKWLQKSKNGLKYTKTINDLCNDKKINVDYIMHAILTNEDRYEALKLYFDYLRAPYFSNIYFKFRDDFFDFLDKHEFDSEKKLKSYLKLKKEIDKHRKTKLNLKESIVEATNLPVSVKALILDELKYDKTDKKTQWARTVLRLPLVIEDVKYSKTLLADVKQNLDEHISFLDVPKTYILMYLQNLVSNKQTNVKALGLYGGMGLGKTFLVKTCLAKSLNRNVYLIKLGGVKSSRYLTGHDYTYIGSQPGIIVRQIITDPNPTLSSIILWDEIDKIEQTDEGRGVIDCVADIIDKTKNSCFHDDYIGTNIDINLSHCLHVFTMNDKSRLSGTSLEDRIEFIHIPDLTKPQKLEIARKHIIPKIETKMTFTDESLTRIIDSYCHNEVGVRQLERNIQKIIDYTHLQTPNYDSVINTEHVDSVMKKLTTDDSATKNYQNMFN